MARLLHIEASPLKVRSQSTSVAERFLDAYRSAQPEDDILKIDLWNVNLPPFDAETIGAKFAVLRTQSFTPEQWERWEAVRSIARRFNAADKYVFSVPMWNFGVPYPLKHFIDVVTLPGENWTWSKQKGYEPLLSGKKALLVYSSANDYVDNKDSDYLKPYMRRWLRFIGVSAISEIDVAPTLADAEAVASRRAAAIAEAEGLALQF